MKPDHRSTLLALAARRGQKGFSGILAEAIEEYLIGEKERARSRKELLSLAGSLGPREARDLRRITRELRESWR